MSSSVQPNSLWSRMHAWSKVLPPSRPSFEQLRYFGASLDTIDRNVPIGVLGATIEYRQLLRAMAFSRVYIFEQDEAYLRSVSPQGSLLSVKHLSSENGRKRY